MPDKRSHVVRSNFTDDVIYYNRVAASTLRVQYSSFLDRHAKSQVSLDRYAASFAEVRQVRLEESC